MPDLFCGSRTEYSQYKQATRHGNSDAQHQDPGNYSFNAGRANAAGYYYTFNAIATDTACPAAPSTAAASADAAPTSAGPVAVAEYVQRRHNQAGLPDGADPGGHGSRLDGG